MSEELPELQKPDVEGLMELVREFGTLRESAGGSAAVFARTAAKSERQQAEQVEAAIRAYAERLPVDARRLDWLDKNIFHREMDDWDKRMRPGQTMWVLFAPQGHQGSARNIIDAALSKDNQGGQTNG